MISLKDDSEISYIKQAGMIVAKTLQLLFRMLEPGLSTLDLDRAAERYIRSCGGVPAFKGYKGETGGGSFPASICTSINEEVVHGIPSSRRLEEGDIISIDVGVKFKGFYADAAATYPVGKISSKAEKLIKAAREALKEGIKYCREGNHLSDISHAIERTALKYNFSVVRKFVGHGIGRKLHEDPQIPNYGPPGQGPLLKSGMVLALEPMVNAGTSEVEVLSDKWTVITSDHQLSAHFEHTVLVGKEPLILTSLAENTGFC